MADKKRLAVVDEETEEEEELDPSILDNVDLALPEDYEAELFAVELLEHTSAYHKMLSARKAARHTEDHQRAEQFGKQILFSRMAAALIQSQYPKAKAIADELARLRARQAAAQRKLQLAKDGDDGA